MVDVAVELDRTYKEVKYLYLDYGAAVGEYDSFFDNSLRDEGIQVQIGDEKVWVKRIPFAPGEQRKTIRLHAAKNDYYRGNRPFELKVLAFENDKVEYKTSLVLNFEEKDPMPIFGIVVYRESDTTATKSKAQANTLALKVTTNARFQFPQQIAIAISGTAVAGEHFQIQEPILFPQQMSYPTGFFATNTFAVLRVLQTANFDPAKTIRVTMTAAEEGEIADGQSFVGSQGERFTMGNSYSLTVTD
jgi:hypothetical protein